jgi:hypothetical protein
MLGLVSTWMGDRPNEQECQVLVEGVPASCGLGSVGEDIEMIYIPPVCVKYRRITPQEKRKVVQKAQKVIMIPHSSTIIFPGTQLSSLNYKHNVRNRVLQPAGQGAYRTKDRRLPTKLLVSASYSFSLNGRRRQR